MIKKKLMKALFRAGWEFYIFIEFIPKRIAALFGKKILSWEQQEQLDKKRKSPYNYYLVIKE